MSITPLALLTPPNIHTLREFEAWKNSNPKKRLAVQHGEHHIPRPPNAYFVFRTHYCKVMPPESNCQQINISKRAALAWSLLTDGEKSPFEAVADRLKADHQTVFPDYKYSPNQRKHKMPRDRYEDEEEERTKSIKIVSQVLGVDKNLTRARALEQDARSRRNLKNPASGPQFCNLQCRATEEDYSMDSDSDYYEYAASRGHAAHTNYAFSQPTKREAFPNTQYHSKPSYLPPHALDSRRNSLSYSTSLRPRHSHAEHSAVYDPAGELEDFDRYFDFSRCEPLADREGVPPFRQR